MPKENVESKNDRSSHQDSLCNDLEMEDKVESVRHRYSKLVNSVEEVNPTVPVVRGFEGHSFEDIRDNNQLGEYVSPKKRLELKRLSDL